MAKFRAIYHQIWADEDFQNYTPEAKLIFIYLCTNNATSESGIYHITKKTISNDTNIPTETVSQVLLNGLKNVMYDLDNSCVYVKRFRKYNAGGQPNLIKLSIISDVKLLHMSNLWNEFVKDYPIYTDDVTKTLKLFDNGLSTDVSKVREGNITKVTLTANVNTKETDGEVRNVFKIFNDNYQQITAEIANRLNDLIDEYSEDKVKWALQEGIDRNARSLKYITKCLENDKQGIKKPETSNDNHNQPNGYKIPLNQYTDVRDYGKYSTPPAP